MHHTMLRVTDSGVSYFCIDFSNICFLNHSIEPLCGIWFHLSWREILICVFSWKQHYTAVFSFVVLKNISKTPNSLLCPKTPNSLPVPRHPILFPVPRNPILFPDPIHPILFPVPRHPILFPVPRNPILFPDPIHPILFPDPIHPILFPDPIHPVLFPDPIHPILFPDPIHPILFPVPRHQFSSLTFYKWLFQQDADYHKYITWSDREKILYCLCMKYVFYTTENILCFV